MIWGLAVACLMASIPAALRWLRVAQREHYLAPSSTRFAWRWWNSRWLNRLFMVLGLIGLFGALIDVRLGFLVPMTQVGPFGLAVQGRTSKLAWTHRLRRLATFTGALLLTLVLAGALGDQAFPVVAALFALPLMVDLGLYLLAPVEMRLGGRWVDRAAAKFSSSGARVVAITGSYGKTTTKIYLKHLISPTVRTVASPASFNNRMGLARAINEHLVPGTEVFIAEMGTYGKGEIAALCRWIQPTIAAIVAVGPVHLERFRTEERIVEAKSEILEGARSAVISVDHPLLAQLAEDRRKDLATITVSAAGNQADVTVRAEDRMLLIGEEVIGPVPTGVFPVNLAVAAGIARSLGVAVDPGLFPSLPAAEHRQTISVSATGVTIIDDTFNSNPAGAKTGLELLEGSTDVGRKVVVTPGMVELGPRQDAENMNFAREAAEVCDHIVVIGATNRNALLRGSSKGRASVTVVDNREAAVEWVRANLTAGDAVLYENDLPDHYP